WSRSGRETTKWYESILEAVAERYNISLSTPWNELDDEARQIILFGAKDAHVTVRYTSRKGRKRQYNMRFEGVIPSLQRRMRETSSDWVREDLGQYMAARPCPECKGRRLRPEILAVTVGDRSIIDITTMSI